MKSGDAEMQEWLEVVVEDAKARAGEHVDLDRLVAYRAGELPPAAEGALQDHLAACPDCTQRLLELEELQADTARESSATEWVDDLAWRDFSRRAGLESGTTRRRAFLPLGALAASLLVLFGLLFWVHQLGLDNNRLRQVAADLGAPQVNPPVLYVEGTVRGASDPLVAVDVPPGQPFLLVIVTPSHPEVFPEYEAEVRDSSGKRIWGQSGLSLTEYGTLRLRFSVVTLPTGEARLLVHGARGERREVVAESSLRVRWP